MLRKNVFRIRKHPMERNRANKDAFGAGFTVGFVGGMLVVAIALFPFIRSRDD